MIERVIRLPARPRPVLGGNRRFRDSCLRAGGGRVCRPALPRSTRYRDPARSRYPVSAWTPGPTWTGGIQFSAKILLEVAVVLLGELRQRQRCRGTRVLALILGIAGIVVVAIASSYRSAACSGLPLRMSILVACGNSICGNSAIAAVAPIIDADSDDVASSIAFTAVLGVIVVLCLPFLVPLLKMSLTAIWSSSPA